MDKGYCLPEWFVESCILKQNFKKSEVITYDDRKLSANQLADTLRAEQYKHFRGETCLEEFLSLSEVEQPVSFQSVSVGSRNPVDPPPFPPLQWGGGIDTQI